MVYTEVLKTLPLEGYGFESRRLYWILSDYEPAFIRERTDRGIYNNTKQGYESRIG